MSATSWLPDAKKVPAWVQPSAAQNPLHDCCHRDLEIEKRYIIYPGEKDYAIDNVIEVVGIANLSKLGALTGLSRGNETSKGANNNAVTKPPLQLRTDLKSRVDAHPQSGSARGFRPCSEDSSE